MKIKLLLLGKTTSAAIDELCKDYQKRISRYCKFEIEIIDNAKIKAQTPALQNQAEADLILNKIEDNAFLILLDEKGKTFSSVEFAGQLTDWMNRSISNYVFLVGGAYGFDKSIYERASFQLCLSKMTFSHQIIRPLFLEQLYRAFSIIRNEPYHNEGRK